MGHLILNIRRKIGFSIFVMILGIFLPYITYSTQRPIVFQASDDELERRASRTSDRIPIGPVSEKRSTLLQLDWTFLGPQPILNEYWSGDDDASGRISAIIVHPSNPNLLYLAGVQGGVWKSTDNGVNWSPISDQLSSLASGALAFDPFNPDIIYYGTGEQHYSGDSFYGDGMFKTTDAGVSWSKIALTSDVGSYIARTLVKPTDSNILHVASDLGYIRSTDGGTTWNIELNPGHCNDIVISPGAPSTIFAGIRGDGIHKTTNDGAAWTQLTNGLPVGGFLRINLAISFSDTNVVYASFVSTNGSLYGMYKTTDGGSSWFNLPNTPNYLRNQGWYDNCVIVDPTDANICYAGGVFPFGPGDYGMIRTTDGGNNWVEIAIGIDSSQIHPDQHILAFGPDTVLWVGNDGGIWKTTDRGDTWVNRNNTLGITQFYTVGLHPTNPNFLLGGTQDNGTARYDGNLGWPQVIAGDGGPCPVEWDSPNIYYTTYVRISPVWQWNNGVFQGDVTGPWSGERASWCNGPLVIDPNQANTILAGTYRVWKTTDSGGTWDTLSGDLTGGFGYLRSIAVSQGNSNILYAGSSGGRVYVTTDGGTNWNLRNAGLPTVPVPDIYPDPSDWQTAYICSDRSFGSRVFKTTNGGVIWTDITGDLPVGLRGLSMAVNFNLASPTLYLGTDYGVYSSANDGTNWVKEGNNLPNLAIYDLGYDGVNDYLIAATHGRGMWRASTIVGIEETNNEYRTRNYEFRLIQNHPNPFSKLTAISYELRAPSHTTLKIYDLSGRLVETLVNEHQKPGLHQLPITSNQLPGSGVYFYRLQTRIGQGSDFISTKKLILLR
jgi:photosystem II stability/assembly factor-like uncharacterized protein